MSLTNLPDLCARVAVVIIGHETGHRGIPQFNGLWPGMGVTDLELIPILWLEFPTILSAYQIKKTSDQTTAIRLTGISMARPAIGFCHFWVVHRSTSW